MLRDALNDLITWKNKTNRKPLIIRGARQVGKTWLMKNFGKNHYAKCAYVNFDNNRRMMELFTADMAIPKIIQALEIETGIKITPKETLIIFDEVQEIPAALTSLKYFCENAPEFHIVAAGSLLGVALHPGTSFPVGKVEFLDLYPLSFREFLQATNNHSLIDLLEKKEFDLISTFKNEYTNLLKNYYYIGGMPEVVNNFVINNDFGQVREIQKTLLQAYEQDFSKHAPVEIVPRIRMIWNSIPAQLAKENKKFTYGTIKHGARAKDFELAIQWLIDCGLIYKVSRISKPNIPLNSYQDYSCFKIYVVDVGLLSALGNIDIKILLERNAIFEEFKGSLSEQYVLQQLVSHKINPFYWSADKAESEVDFVFQYQDKVFPIEVKASENLQSKSLKVYHAKYNPFIALRTSMSNYRRENWLLNIPLYCMSTIVFDDI